MRNDTPKRMKRDVGQAGSSYMELGTAVVEQALADGRRLAKCGMIRETPTGYEIVGTDADIGRLGMSRSEAESVLPFLADKRLLPATMITGAAGVNVAAEQLTKAVTQTPTELTEPEYEALMDARDAGVREAVAVLAGALRQARKLAQRVDREPYNEHRERNAVSRRAAINRYRVESQPLKMAHIHATNEHDKRRKHDADARRKAAKAATKNKEGTQ